MGEKTSVADYGGADPKWEAKTEWANYMKLLNSAQFIERGDTMSIINVKLFYKKITLDFWIKMMDMITSSDPENYIVAKEIINNLPNDIKTS